MSCLKSTTYWAPLFLILHVKYGIKRPNSLSFFFTILASGRLIARGFVGQCLYDCFYWSVPEHSLMGFDGGLHHVLDVILHVLCVVIMDVLVIAIHY